MIDSLIENAEEIKAKQMNMTVNVEIIALRILPSFRLAMDLRVKSFLTDHMKSVNQFPGSTFLLLRDELKRLSPFVLSRQG